MPIFKLTTLFQYASAVSSPQAPVHRTGGFSESWYTNATTAGQVIQLASLPAPNAVLAGLWPLRAALLPIGTSIIGFRLQQVQPLGPSQAGSVLYPGSGGFAADIPQMALLCRAQGLGVNNIRRFTLRAIPDVMVIEGEAMMTAAFQQAVNAFLQSLAVWNFRGRDLSQPTYKIITVTPGTGGSATVALEVAYAGAVGDMVRILRTVDSGHNLRGGRFQVTGIVAPSSVTIANWTAGSTVLGTLRKDGVVYPSVDITNTVGTRIVTRRIGRPFIAWRGRRSKRR